MQAVSAYQSSGACNANVETAVSSVEAALEAASTAAEEPTSESVQAAYEAANTARECLHILIHGDSTCLLLADMLALQRQLFVSSSSN